MAGRKHVVCYYASWAHYRHGLAKYTVEDIPVELCTHLVYAFAVLDSKTLLAKQHDSWLDRDLKNYEKFVQLKKKNRNLKVLLGLGGWNDSRSNKYSRLVADAGLRRKFVDEVIKLLLQYGFDGLDLDWEYPAYEGISADKQGFTAWLVDLKSAFRPHGLLLTSAVSAGRRNIDRGYDIPKVSELLDLVILMAYDFHGSWENRVAHHSPLYPEPGQNPELCADFAVNYWLKKGTPAHKLVLGLPLYGRSWTLAGPENFPGAAAVGPGRAGRYVKATGNLAFFECCLAHKKEGWTKVTGDGGPYITKGDQWAGYDDVDAVVKKAQYALSKDLGGIMVWDTVTDDFGNYCGLGHNPLLTAIATTLNGSSPTTALVSQHGGSNIPPTDHAPTKPWRNKESKEESHLGGRKGTTDDRANDSTGINSITTTRKNPSVVHNEGSGLEQTTELPYAWLAWPFFRRLQEQEQNLNSISTTESSLFNSRISTPYQSNFQSHSFALSSPSRFNSRLSTTTQPTVFSSLLSPSSSSSAASASWFAECKELGHAPDPFSCSSFYKCTNSFAYKFACPGGLLWHQDLLSCDWPSAVQCILPLSKPNIRLFLPPEVSHF
ncbi:chitinase-3-like protein 1 isoform X2 [Panulirus ornatus]